jgi:hypothetical protein
MLNWDLDVIEKRINIVKESEVDPLTNLDPLGPVKRGRPPTGDSQKAHLKRLRDEWRELKAQLHEQMEEDKEDMDMGE